MIAGFTRAFRTTAAHAEAPGTTPKSTGRVPSMFTFAARVLTLIAFTTTIAPADSTPGPRLSSDPAKSALEYQFIQAGAQNKGKFTRFQVTLVLAPGNLATSKLDVMVDMGSLDTGDKERDDTLRGAELFWVSKFPQARFISSQITKTATGYDAIGKLTLRGVSRDVHVPFTIRTADEQGKTVSYLTGKTTIKRLDFGIGQGDWQSTEWVGNEVAVSYSLRLVPAS